LNYFLLATNTFSLRIKTNTNPKAQNTIHKSLTPKSCNFFYLFVSILYFCKIILKNQIKKIFYMKNLVKGIILLSFVANMIACKNETKTAEATTPEATPAVTPESAPATTTTTDAAAPATTATPAPTTTTSAEGNVKATPEVKKEVVATEAAKPGKSTTMQFEESKFNWGSIKENEKMTHMFKFKNTGKEPLVIIDAKGSCGCTVPEKPNAPILPGKTGEIKVVFDSKGKPGEQTKTVTVTANTTPETMVLTITGKVEAAEKTDK
jgi:Protein of unknown function (DUF1573)